MSEISSFHAITLIAVFITSLTSFLLSQICAELHGTRGTHSVLSCAEEQHRRLVAYYERVLSFERLREVGDNGLRDLPDLLVWGGAGTRMNADIPTVLKRWCKAFQAVD